MVGDEDVLEVLAESTGLERRELSTRWSLVDLGLTSFRVMRAVMQIEERFAIEFSDDEIVRFAAAPASSLVHLVSDRLARSGT